MIIKNFHETTTETTVLNARYRQLSYIKSKKVSKYVLLLVLMFSAVFKSTQYMSLARTQFWLILAYCLSLTVHTMALFKALFYFTRTLPSQDHCVLISAYFGAYLCVICPGIFIIYSM